MWAEPIPGFALRNHIQEKAPHTKHVKLACHHRSSKALASCPELLSCLDPEQLSAPLGTETRVSTMAWCQFCHSGKLNQYLQGIDSM